MILLPLAASVPYFLNPVYNMPPPEPFEGKMLYNPYSAGSSNWFKANFDAHSKAWYGILGGTSEPEDVYFLYQQLGYDVISISDYQKITRRPFDGDLLYLASTEHGFNIFERNYISLAPTEILWIDYTAWQLIHHKQAMINLLGQRSSYLIAAHPGNREAFAPSDFSYLSMYNAIEIITHNSNSVVHWDSALSAGRAVWGIGSDHSFVHTFTQDSLSAVSEKQTGVAWTMIGANSLTYDDIYNSLNTGNFYAVSGSYGRNLNLVESVKLDEIVIKIKCKEKADEFRFYGQGGQLLGSVVSSDEAFYAFGDDDHYIRTEIQTGESVIYLNPVIRIDPEGGMLQVPTPDSTQTWIYRVILALGIIFYLAAVITISSRIRKWKKKRKEKKADKAVETLSDDSEQEEETMSRRKYREEHRQDEEPDKKEEESDASEEEGKKDETQENQDTENEEEKE